jgi:hypothetical protein
LRTADIEKRMLDAEKRKEQEKLRAIEEKNAALKEKARQMAEMDAKIARETDASSNLTSERGMREKVQYCVCTCDARSPRHVR